MAGNAQRFSPVTPDSDEDFLQLPQDDPDDIIKDLQNVCIQSNAQSVRDAEQYFALKQRTEILEQENFALKQENRKLQLALTEILRGLDTVAQNVRAILQDSQGTASDFMHSGGQAAFSGCQASAASTSSKPTW